MPSWCGAYLIKQKKILPTFTSNGVQLVLNIMKIHPLVQKLQPRDTEVNKIPLAYLSLQNSDPRESPHTWMPGFQKSTNIIYMIGTVCRLEALCWEWHHGKTRCNVTNVKV
jgi:hypothetical protein